MEQPRNSSNKVGTSKAGPSKVGTRKKMPQSTAGPPLLDLTVSIDLTEAHAQMLSPNQVTSGSKVKVHDPPTMTQQFPIAPESPELVGASPGDLRRFMGFMSGRYYCRLCGKDYKSKYNLMDHMNLHKNEQHQCDKCGKSFGHARYLQQHKKHVHGELRRFDCKHCYRRFMLREEFHEHMEMFHPAVAQSLSDADPE